MASDTLVRQALSAPRERAGTDGRGMSVAEVYAAHFRYVWRCLRALGVQHAALDDATQEVFLVVHRKLAAFDGRFALRTWLYAIALHVARRHRAQAAVHARRFAELETTIHCDPLEQVGAIRRDAADLRLDVERHERLSLAQSALEHLDDDKREVFVLCSVEGMTAPEVSEAAGIPLNTVYSRLRAAREAFAAAVKTLQLEPLQPKPAPLAQRNRP
jgi:RNA polymerase sigma-70 factor (ECF subfamily)